MFGALTVLILILAIIITAQNVTKDSEKKTDTSLAKPSPTKSQNPSSTFAPTPSLKANSTPSKKQPTNIPPTSTPTSKPEPPSQTISDFQYPSSIVISKIDTTINLESTDDPKQITDWYKEKIKAMDMNVTTFVQTSTNGNILNKLVGANGNQEVGVEITKQNNSQIVKISASLSLDN